MAARSTTSARSARAAVPTVPLGVPVTARATGSCAGRPQLVPYAECAEVTGSHVGLIFNRKSYRAIARVLAAPERSAQTLSGVSVRHP